jgi:hypothetical protein
VSSPLADSWVFWSAGSGNRGYTTFFLPFVSVEDPHPDPHVFGPPGSGAISQRFRIQILPFSHKGVEWTEIMTQNKILTQNFSKKFNF